MKNVPILHLDNARDVFFLQTAEYRYQFKFCMHMEGSTTMMVSNHYIITHMNAARAASYLTHMNTALLLQLSYVFTPRSNMNTWCIRHEIHKGLD